MQLLGEYIRKDTWITRLDDYVSLLTPARYQRYLENVNELFSNTSYNLRSNLNFTQCSRNKDQMIYIEHLYFNFLLIGDNISRVSSYDEAYNYAKQMLTLFTQMQPFRDEEKELHEKLKKPCDWLRNEYKPNLEKFRKCRDQRNTVLTKFKSISYNFLQLNSSFLDLLPTLEKTRLYLKNNATKFDLAKSFENRLFRKYIQDFSYHAKELETSIQNYLSEMNTFSDQIKLAYKELFTIRYPIINSHNVYQLKLISGAQSINDNLIMIIVESLKENMETNILKLWDLIFERLTINMIRIKSAVVLSADDIITEVNEFTSDLRKYKESLKVETDFLM